MASWETTTTSTTFEDKFKPTLVARAKKRTGVQVGERKWVVDGNHKLGDSYEEYFVILPEGERKYHCSCQNHQGGEYRKLCSHSLYVMLARKGKVSIEVSIKPELPESSAPLFEVDRVAYPFRDLPDYVEGSGASIQEAREELDKMFCGNLEYRPLPEWVEYIRPAQQFALEQIEALYAEGKKVVFLDAPTGAGKTLIGEMVRRRESPGKTIYTCTTLTLQDQFLEDFEYADVIKGRSNYPTLDNPKGFPLVNAGMCTAMGKDECALCSDVRSCPYTNARNIALKSKLAVANISYLLTMANYQGRMTDEPFIIIDEADVLEQQLLGFITVSLSKKNMVKYNINQPPAKGAGTKSNPKGEVWVDWMRSEAIPKLKESSKNLQRELGRLRNNPEKAVKVLKEKNTVDQLVKRMYDLGGWDAQANGWSKDHDLEGWVYMDYEKGDATFKPITVADYAQDVLWKHSKKWLLMSATIISAQQMADDLGLEDHEWGVVTIDSDFPIDQRPLYIQPVANMTYKDRDIAYPQMVATINKSHDCIPIATQESVSLP